MSRPIPSTMVPMACMPIVPVHAKIRILGCFTTYDSVTVTLTLSHIITSEALKNAVSEYGSSYIHEQKKKYKRELQKLQKLQQQTPKNNNNNNNNNNKGQHILQRRKSIRKPDLSQSIIEVRIENLVPILPNLRPKEWVNIVGYKKEDGSILAVMLWRAAELDLVRYERILASILDERRMEGRPLAELRDGGEETNLSFDDDFYSSISLKEED